MAQPWSHNGLWTTLADANVDIVLNGHDHDYERIYRDGVREFIVGTGGKSLGAFGGSVSGSQFRYNANYGVLFLALGSDATYSWQVRTQWCRDRLWHGRVSLAPRKMARPCDVHGLRRSCSLSGSLQSDRIR